ncbi:hypothetical protein ALI144C_04325 [Actinosynnema sp. ALI-1.44]|uniref:MFS transporter n=1 Tax=Actinosynnema sp. ALI-1.44 TaxID=1933779 RepID=UPI00097BF620|nr:MFS transporter [Actinosynnema sp. ALI-1.44]ONI89579.1 hypothetical protein ALI144C_04325 [Actinosynnema sp. ALI-1.44]
MIRAVEPLRHRGFRFLVAGQLASNVGDVCYAVALPWYVLSAGGGALTLGVVLAAYGIPRTLLLAVGGKASDRWQPWTVMMVADGVRAIGVAALAVEAALGPARIGIIVPIAALVGAGTGFFLPGSFAIVPTLLPDKDLQAGNALASGGTQLAALTGPALGGVLVACLGPAPAFAIDAATFVVSALSLLGVRSAQRHTTRGRREEPSFVGLRALIRAIPILPFGLAATAAANLGLGGLSEVALPSLVRDTLQTNATFYGGLLAAIAAGALVGTLVAGQVRSPPRPAVFASCAFLLQAATLAVAPYPNSTWALGVAMVIVGLSNGFANVLMITTFQRSIPPALLGRASGVLLLASFGVLPISVALAGFVVDEIGPAPFFPVAAAILAAANLAALCQRRWRALGTADQSDWSASRTRVASPNPAELRN